ncbi:MAG TPA: PQQ-dependent sugar dehydrogenase [Anaerolineae bacterium]|nr:PQQ-dependent sugar dehydrogenase [Anaerolineae bacterium]
MVWRQVQRFGLAMVLLLTVSTVMFWQFDNGGAAGGDEPPLPELSFELVANGFFLPVDVAHAGDERLFVVEQWGTVKIVTGGGRVEPTPFFEIPSGQITTTGPEQGLLGLTFDPDYETNGYFYVNYTDETEATRIARFERDADNPNQASFDTEFLIFTVPQPASNHNAGDIAFGPDGYLYVPLGDGGSANDPWQNGQDLGTLLGGMLRLDVHGGGNAPDCGTGNYTIPADNPFVGVSGACDESWAYGLRNPWRFSFDRATGDMYIGDVGQGGWEEINYQPASSAGGENYGWRCFEGNQLTGLCGVTPDNHQPPAIDYPHTQGRAITGGFVYRGLHYGRMQGVYIFADFIESNFWVMQPATAGGWDTQFLGRIFSGSPSSFGEGADGELYLADYNGGLYQVQSALAPTAMGDEIELFEQEAQLIDVLANDTVEEGALSLVSVGVPDYGTAVISGTMVLYTAPADYTGIDSFEYLVTDGLDMSEGLVTVTVENWPNQYIPVVVKDE